MNGCGLQFRLSRIKAHIHVVMCHNKSYVLSDFNDHNLHNISRMQDPHSYEVLDSVDKYLHPVFKVQ